MKENDYSDLEYGNLIYLFDSRTYQTKLVKLTNYELLAAKMACLETGMPLAQLVYTPNLKFSTYSLFSYIIDRLNIYLCDSC